jgi:hypothetical protein
VTDQSADESSESVEIVVNGPPGWSHSWGGEQSDLGRGIAVSNTGDCYAAGHTWSFGAGYFDYILLKYNTDGELLWERTWGGGQHDEGQCVCVDEDSNAYIGGSTVSFGAGGKDFAVVKFDAAGLEQMDITWGGSQDEVAYEMVVDQSGGIYVAGTTNTFGAGDDDACLVKFDSTGELLWQTSWGGNQHDRAYCMTLDNQSSVYVSGYTASYGEGSSDILVLKYDLDGDLLWARTWGGPEAQSGWAGVKTDDENNVYVAGFSWEFGSGLQEVVLLKFSPDGELLWDRVWGSEGTEMSYGLAVDGTGTSYISGLSSSHRALLIKFDSTGDLHWSRHWGSSGTCYGYEVAIGNDDIPFMICQGGNASGVWSNTLGIVSAPAVALGTPNGTVRTPAGVVGMPGGTVTEPSGIQDTGAGTADIVIIKGAN